MPDRTILFYNTIMKCSDYEYKEPELPDGFSIAGYQPGYEKEWARLEYAIEDFGSLEEAERYFVDTYLKDTNEYKNILFALNEKNEVVGSCIAWQDERKKNKVSSLHWLVVDERYQGQGIGRALCTAVMNIYKEREALPIYIHTQPWSWKAILLYISLGFKLQKTDEFSHYINEYEKAMAALSKVVTEKQYELMIDSSEE